MKLSVLFDDPETKNAVTKAEQDAVARINTLTAQQKAVLPLICDGLLNKQAAHALEISQRTIENHRSEIMKRTGCSTVAQLIRLYQLAS